VIMDKMTLNDLEPRPQSQLQSPSKEILYEKENLGDEPQTVTP